MSEKTTNKINRIAIVSGIATIIAVVTFFAKGFGSVAIAQQDIDELNKFKDKQVVINESTSNQFASISTNLEWIKEFLKKSK